MVYHWLEGLPLLFFASSFHVLMIALLCFSSASWSLPFCAFLYCSLPLLFFLLSPYSSISISSPFSSSSSFSYIPLLYSHIQSSNIGSYGSRDNCFGNEDELLRCRPCFVCQGIYHLQIYLPTYLPVYIPYLTESCSFLFP